MKKTKFPLPDERHLKQLLTFLIKFNIFAIPLYIILITDWTFPWLQTTTANIVYSILTSLGYSPFMDNMLITIPIKNGNWAAFINWDCTGWKSMLAFFALVMSTDLPFTRKLSGLFVLPLIYAINIIRIVFMFFFVRSYDLAYYEIVHSFIWSWGLIFAILTLWILWMTREELHFLSYFKRYVRRVEKAEKIK